MRIVQVSKNGKMLKLSDPSLTQDTWYFMTPKVQEYVTQQNIGVSAEVDVRTETKDGAKTITFLQNGNGAAATVATVKDDAPAYTPPANRTKYQARDNDTQESIIRQSVMKCAVEAVKSTEALPPDPNEVANFTIAVYEKLLAKVKE